MDFSVKDLLSHLKGGLKCSVYHGSYDGYRALQVTTTAGDKAASAQTRSRQVRVEYHSAWSQEVNSVNACSDTRPTRYCFCSQPSTHIDPTQDLTAEADSQRVCVRRKHDLMHHNSGGSHRDFLAIADALSVKPV